MDGKLEEINPHEIISSSGLDEYYPAIALHTLMKILKDPNLSQYYSSVVNVSTVFNFISVLKGFI